MQTRFSLAQLADPATAESNKILRACVHCGFCTATCPTYVLLGDELDSTRGRIYLIKDMLEQGRSATADVVRHVDRCLSCLACMTTCPSGVHSHRRSRPGISGDISAACGTRWDHCWRQPPYARLRARAQARPHSPACCRDGFSRLRAARPGAVATAYRAHSSGRNHAGRVAFQGCGTRFGASRATTVLNRLASVVTPGQASAAGLVLTGRRSRHAGGINIDLWTRDRGAGADAIVVNVSGLRTI
jgi:glycolate oxidase iron-sulfur subunit